MPAVKKKTATKKKKATRTRKARKPPLAIPVIAEGIGVSTRTIDKYVKRGCPRTSIADVQQWRAENIKAVAEDADPSEVLLELKRAELADKYESARTRKIKNDILEGRLLDADDYRTRQTIVYGRIRARLMSLGMQCANACPSALKPIVKKIVEECVRIALKEAADECSQP